MRSILYLLTVTILAAHAGFVFAERTDVVVLYNGNTITGEVKSMQQGKLKFKTDHLDTIFIEWEFVRSVSSQDFFEVENQRGEFFYGTLAPGPEDFTLRVVESEDEVVIEMERVVDILPIKQKFFDRIDGSLNLGFSYTSADSLLQYSLESDATYYQRKYTAAVGLSSIQTFQEGRDDIFRNNLIFIYTRFHKNRYFSAGSLGFSSSSELGIQLRSELGYAFGRTFKQTNRSRLSASAGFGVNRETPVGKDPTDYLLVGLLGGNYKFFLYNYPKTDISVDLAVIPGITAWPRMRVEFSGSLKREIMTDFTVNLSIFDSYDSDPPSEASSNHDFGTVLSVGWIF